MKTRGRRAGSRHRRGSNSIQLTPKKMLDQINIATDKTKHKPSSLPIKVLTSTSQTGKIKSPQVVASPPPPGNTEQKIAKLSSPWPCPLTCAQLSEQRSHLCDVTVLQKRSIVISDLSKSQFPSQKKIKEHFLMYGKICKFVMDPKGLSRSELYNGKDGKNNLYITYLTERSALNAIRATDGKYLDGATSCKVQATFARSRYCPIFLAGKHCQNLNCVLLHELIVDESKESKKIEKPNRTLEEECSAMKLTVLTREKNKKGMWSVQPLPSTKVQTKVIHFKNNFGLLSSSSASHITQSQPILNEAKNAIIGKERDVENLSTPLPASKKARQEVDPKISPMDDDGIHNFCMDQITSKDRSKHFKERDLKSLGLPAKQLFKNKSLGRVDCIISPPKENGVNLEFEGYDNPWGLKSPVSFIYLFA